MPKKESRVYLGSAKIEKMGGEKFNRDIYTISNDKSDKSPSEKVKSKKIPNRGCSSCRGSRKI